MDNRKIRKSEKAGHRTNQPKRQKRTFKTIFYYDKLHREIKRTGLDCRGK